MVKKYIVRCLLLVFLANSPIHAHNPPNPEDLDYFFLHPISLISGIRKSETIIYLTIKGPLNEDEYIARDGGYYRKENPKKYLDYLIINPSFLNKEDYYRIGSGLGYRRNVLSFEDKVFCYFQIMPSVHYLEYSKANSGAIINVLGYVGTSLKSEGFFDVGVGYEWNFVEKKHGLKALCFTTADTATDIYHLE